MLNHATFTTYIIYFVSEPHSKIYGARDSEGSDIAIRASHIIIKIIDS